MIRSDDFASNDQLWQLVDVQESVENGFKRVPISALIDIDDEWTRGDAVPCQHLLNFSMPGIAHFAVEYDGVDRVNVFDQ